jgi:hypothetical protein
VSYTFDVERLGLEAGLWGLKAGHEIVFLFHSAQRLPFGILTWLNSKAAPVIVITWNANVSILFILFLLSLFFLPSPLPPLPLQASVSPDGIRLLAEGGRGSHAAVSPDGIRLVAEGGRGHHVAVSPDGIRLLGEGGQGQRVAVSQ